MKIRSAFVANSSSSSFLLIKAGDEIIAGDNYDPQFETDFETLDIDELILKLQEAKAKGVTRLEIEYGGGYDG